MDCAEEGGKDKMPGNLDEAALVRKRGELNALLNASKASVSHSCF
jgi:hypothetical protein